MFSLLFSCDLVTMSSSLSQALSLHWAYGFSKDKIHAVHSLCTKDRNALLLMSSHSGVIYDYEHRTQTILQGHCNIISCCVVDKNKRWIVTADSGTDSILVVWDAIACVPIKTYSVPHDNGIDAIDFSNDSLYLVTLSSPYRDDYLDQEIAIWAWTTDSNEPILRQRIQSNDMHTSVRFNPMKSSQIVSTGTKSISFWHWDEFNLDSYFGKVSKADLGNYSGSFVTTTYLKGTETALTATSDGYVIVWETQFEMKKKNHDPNNSAHNFMKKATKVLRLVECGINVMTTTDNEYLVIGCADGSVRFYDFFLRAEAWYEDLSAGAINAISFSIQNCPYPSGEAGAPGLKFWVSDFIVATADAFVIGVESSIFDEVRAEDRRGTLLMQGMANTVTGVSCHPSGPLVALNCSSGVIQVWNYDLKLLMNLREFNDRAALAVVTDERTNYLTKGDKKAAVFMQSTCLSYDATGRLLAVGFDNGTIKLLDSETLADFATIVPASDAILSIHFSPSGNYFACNDSNNHLLLFERLVRI